MLDLAGGSGWPAIPLAKALPEAHVTCTGAPGCEHLIEPFSLNCDLTHHALAHAPLLWHCHMVRCCRRTAAVCMHVCMWCIESAVLRDSGKAHKAAQ